MKKLMMVLFAAIFLSAVLSSCKASPTPAPSGSVSPSASSSPSAASSSSSSPSVSPGTAKTGLAVITGVSKSMEAGESDGTAEVDSTVVAVTVDKDGKILSCAIDAVQAKIVFDNKGQLKTPMTTLFKTKNELGDDYGLQKASAIGKEWYEQSAAFSKYVQGMSVEEVKGIKVDEMNYATSADLKASVTISIGDFVKGIEKAVSMAQDAGAAEADKLTVGIISNMGKSVSATAEGAGLAQVYSTYTAVTLDTAGAITSCIIDASQSNISFSAGGKILTDLSVNPQTKNELGEAYGLKKASGIGKEWNEQAAAFAQYVTGKTALEINGIAVDEKGYAISSDIKSSVTISIGDFKAVVAKAATV